MSSRIIITVLCLLSLGLGLVAWRQNAARLELESQLRAATEMKSMVAKPAPAASASPVPAPSPAAATPAPINPPEPDSEARRAQISARNDTPEAQRLMQMQTRSALDAKYASLFMYLDLPSEKLQILQILLQDRQNIFRDVTMAMRNQGIAPTPENGPKIQALVNNAAAEIEAQISASLGEADYARYQRFQSSPMPRVTAERIQQRLSYTQEPLSASQYSRLMDILMQDHPGVGGIANSATSMAPSPVNAGNPPLVTSTIIDQARAFLSPAQLSAMESIQREQQASAELAARQPAPSP